MTRFAVPNVMLAPNGANRSKADHPGLPVTLPEIVACARECQAAGVDGIHAHVRDPAGRHVLDTSLYRELLQELGQQAPGLRVQVTSEAAGRYQAHEQQAMIRELLPAYVSVGMREMFRDDSAATLRQAGEFYHWAAGAGVCIQHILYSAAELQHWYARVAANLIPRLGNDHVLFVLGRYQQQQHSSPADLQPFVQLMQHHADHPLDWAVCAFGAAETHCLLAAHQQGGKLRIGFENSLWHSDGRLAGSNLERVQELFAALNRQA